MYSDTLSVTDAAINIVEGVYSQDSDGFDRSTHVRHFNGVKAWADATGVNIYNTNPESAVHQFEHRELP